MNFHKAIVVVCGLALFGVPVYAHHAFAAEFNANKPVMLTGTVTRFEWQNPHARLYLRVQESPEAITNWELELGSPSGLMHQGWTRDLLKRGDILTATGYLARDGARLVAARTIRFTDGRSLAAGSSADGGPAK
jgi:hypothetical protein